VGYPCLVRPSYVLGGRAMEIVYDEEQLERFARRAFEASPGFPVLIDKFLEDAIEVDVDLMGDGTAFVIGGILEHIEEAGIHSGDSAMVLPPHTLNDETLAEIRAATHKLARALGIVGLMNVQFAVKDDVIYILEVNPRASRTAPFVAKATGVPVAKVAARVMTGEKLAAMGLPAKQKPAAASRLAVKTPVFPFARFAGVDTVLGPEMRSTGESMGLDRDFARAFAKAQMGAGIKLPLGGACFISVKNRDKDAAIPLARRLVALGFRLVATGGTAATLQAAGVPVERINKVYEGQPHVVDAMINGDIQMMMNTTAGGAQTLADSFSLRRTALMQGIPHYTTMAGAKAAVEAIGALQAGALEVASLQSYLEAS
jgi:carbamoyl-phosphate synthase large subunit